VLKTALRKAALVRRDALEIDDRLEWDAAIAALALDGLTSDVWGDGPVSAYWPIRSEADPRPILEGLRDRGLALCLPAMAGGRMLFRSWTPWEPIVPGGFGTLVPREDAAELVPATLIVPLVAFDRRGHRIGYGKGHFDRALAELTRTRGSVRTVGIAYAVQEVARVPDEPHDRPLDAIVTERGVIQPRQSAARP
jgi:5-formyltetrahydrofolate cyclo-ligase